MLEYAAVVVEKNLASFIIAILQARSVSDGMKLGILKTWK
jgi:hypothetical protein